MNWRKKWASNRGRKFDIYDIGPALSEAYGIASSVATATTSFRITGIWPFNPDIFDGEFQINGEVTEVEHAADENVERAAVENAARGTDVTVSVGEPDQRNNQDSTAVTTSVLDGLYQQISPPSKKSTSRRKRSKSKQAKL